MHLLTHHLQTVSLFVVALYLGAMTPPLLAQDQNDPASQTITLHANSSQPPYAFAIYANHDVRQPDDKIVRAVVIVHGVKRNAADYFATGEKLLQLARLDAGDTLLVAPHFMTRSDQGATSAMPLWGGGQWMQGELSTHGVKDVSSFDALDAVVRTLADRARFPSLKEIVLIGHSAGAQLMQRYAVLNAVDGSPQMAGIVMRYVISSPSSYLYLEASRPDGGRFDVPADTGDCPDYNQYRYGIDNLPSWLGGQALNGETLFRRYAARRVTYMVGTRDTDPAHRFLDKSCGAELQGNTRVARQTAYRHYEEFLSARWGIPIDHPGFQVSGVGHSAAGLFGTEDTARRLFTTSP